MCKIMLKVSKPGDGVSVQNISEKAKNPYRSSKFPLHKNFKLVLEPNVTFQTYPKLSCRSRKLEILTHFGTRYVVLLDTSQSNMVSRWQMLNCFPRFLEKTYSTLLLFYDALKNYRYIQLFLTSTFRIALVVLLVSDILWTRNTIE